MIRHGRFCRSSAVGCGYVGLSCHPEITLHFGSRNLLPSLIQQPKTMAALGQMASVALDIGLAAFMGWFVLESA